MAPPKPSNMKQKTLLGFLNPSPANATPAKESAATLRGSTHAISSSPTVAGDTVPGSSLASARRQREKSGMSETTALASTPACSDTEGGDAIMGNDDGDDGEAVVRTTRRIKRKLVLVDSDEEDVDDVGEEPVSQKSSSAFANKLAGFKQPAKSATSKKPAKKARTSSPAGGDSDPFIVSDDAEDDEDMYWDNVDEIDLDALEASAKSASKAKPKAKPVRPPPRPTDKGSGSGAKSASATNFLTAAEQRMQNQKVEKKSNEEFYSFLQDPKDKDGNKAGDPNYDPRTLYIPPKAWKTFTPFELQFWKIKSEYMDTVLFFQKGKFYELYEKDAEIGHTEFDLKMTDRVKMKMVGVPEMSFDFWAAKFLAKGYKVGRVDQVETSLGAEMRVAAGKSTKKGTSGKEIVRRELNKVLTNGTLVDAEMLTDEQAGHCVSIREEENKENSFGICVLDASTGEFNLCAFLDDACRTKLETVLRQLRPKEILYTKGNLTVPTTRLLKTLLPESCLWTALRESEGMDYHTTLKKLHELFPGDEDEENGGIPEAITSMLGQEGAVKALGSMMWYLRQLNMDQDLLSMKNFNIYDPMRKGMGLVLDGQTLSHIEVLLNSEGTEEGSLLQLLRRCLTPFGKRLFRIWLCMPLRDVQAINDRLDAVDDIMKHPTFEDDFTKVAKGLPDLERIVSRIHAGSCKVKDFLKVLSSFKTISDAFKEFATTAESFDSQSIAGLLRGAPDLTPNLNHVEEQFEQLKDDPDVLMPKEGKDEAYDEVQETINGLEGKLNDELQKFKKKLGCKNLEYWNSGLGNKEIYLIQVPAGETKKVPKNWVKNSAIKACTRYIVPDLANTIRSLKEARETRNTVIRDFKLRLFQDFDTDRDIWLRAVKVLAELDCLFSLAKSSAALGQPVCRPEFVESDAAFVEFEGLRHPALCLKEGGFIPNDVVMGGRAGKIMLLTGPNMAGKSTLMRMTAAGVIMAQLGMYIPAKSARLSPVDSILTRMGAYDNMFSNSSTFKVELDECCKILREATPKSLVILDELGRGTSTFDGMAIAGAVLHQLATHTLALACFATHYGSLTDDFKYHPSIRCCYMKTVVDDEKHEAITPVQLIFLYQLATGAASSSFGTHVANLAGVPCSVVERAEVISKDFAKQFKAKLRDQEEAGSLPLTTQADFAYLHKLATGLVGLDEDPARKREVLKIIRMAVGGDGGK
ncbi:hypothetical protein BOTBODRAFT_167161 [Botryobasidium botryosum FD-172 SS1]|uniref:DNA mismatch repair protein n=1 Tax=Botryobasidium botryosum (strain FD-172 SS1) TaxID=930990 RepID=A0A067LVI2_BOTB1|nr:hypothetical protein BOTBODRAFT_167161 [Botryobasidium botryosum FD-172 SS1]